MKVPQLKKKPELKSCHNTTWEDNYSWIHQDNILEVLKDSSKLLPDVRKYLEEENNFTEYNLKDTKKYQKTLSFSFIFLQKSIKINFFYNFLKKNRTRNLLTIHFQFFKTAL